MIFPSLKNEITIPTSVDWVTPGTLVRPFGLTRDAGSIGLSFWLKSGGKYILQDNFPLLYLENKLLYDDQFYAIRGVKDQRTLSRRHLIAEIYFLVEDKIIWKNVIKETLTDSQEDIEIGLQELRASLFKYFEPLTNQSKKPGNK